MDIIELETRVVRLEQSVLKMADIMERMAKANADVAQLIAKLGEILGEQVKHPVSGEGIPTGEFFGKEPPRHVLD